MFRRYEHDKVLLGVVYLFLSAEKRISDDDYALFEEVGKSIDEFPEMKSEIVGKCEGLLAGTKEADARFRIVTEYFSSLKSSVDGENENKDILWTLVDLLYQLKAKSEKHHDLVELWVEVNQIDKSIFWDMCDTCETQNSITEYQKWLEASKGMSYQEVNSIMQELEKNQKSLEQSVSDLIALE